MRVSGWHFCGCAILSAEYVISTAHCINLYADNPGQKICVGSRNREPGMEGRLIDIANRIINPGYIPQNFSNDIGIIQLSSQIDFVRDKAKSIEISKNQLDDNDLVVFTGWGWTVSFQFFVYKLFFYYIKDFKIEYRKYTNETRLSAEDRS